MYSTLHDMSKYKLCDSGLEYVFKLIACYMLLPVLELDVT